MAVSLMPQRPPYVEFERRAEEDREATIRENRLVLKDVDYALIRACGSKDCVEKPAVEWLTHIEKLANMGDYPHEWVKFFRKQYEDWKAGHEVTPAMGFPIKHWPAITRAQAETLIAARVLTVEDLAEANEETLRRIGIGGRALKDRARAWLDSSKQHQNAEELAALRVRVQEQDAQIADLRQLVQELTNALTKYEQPEQSQQQQQPAKARRAAAS